MVENNNNKKEHVYSYEQYKRISDEIFKQKMTEGKQGASTARTGVVSGDGMMHLVRARIEEILKETNPLKRERDITGRSYSIVDVMAHSVIAGMFYDELVEQLGSKRITDDIEIFEPFAQSLIPFLAAQKANKERQVNNFVKILDKHIDEHPQTSKRVMLLLVDLLAMLRK